MLVHHGKLDVALSARLRYAYLHGTRAGDDCADDISRDTANNPRCSLVATARVSITTRMCGSISLYRFSKSRCTGVTRRFDLRRCGAHGLVVDVLDALDEALQVILRGGPAVAGSAQALG